MSPNVRFQEMISELTPQMDWKFGRNPSENEVLEGLSKMICEGGDVVE
jgi:hypothetical protein